MRSGEEGLTSFNKNNRANFPVKKSAIKLSGKSIFCRLLEKINYILSLQWSTSQPFHQRVIVQRDRPNPLPKTLLADRDQLMCFLPTEIPVFPTITARVTFQDFKSCDNIPSSMFFIPRDYKVSRLDSLLGKNQINNHFAYPRNRHHVTVVFCPFDFLF